MKPEDAIFLAGESIPVGAAMTVRRRLALGFRRLATRARNLVASDDLGTRVAAVALMFGGLAGLVWAALRYAAAL